MRFFISLILFFNFSYSLNYSLADNYANGQIVPLEQWNTYMDYCFMTDTYINERVFGFDNISQVDYNYRLYDLDAGELLLGYGEIIFYCLTENEAYRQYNNNTSFRAGNQKKRDGKPYGYQSFLKRSKADKCNGFDNFDGYFGFYECNASTGAWRLVPDAVAGTWDDRSQTYECYDSQTEDYYQGSSYVTMHMIKGTFLGVVSDLGFMSQTYSCNNGTVENTRVDNTVELRSGYTTSKQSSGLPAYDGSGSTSGGTTGETGGTGGTATDLTPQLQEISTDLTEIKSQNTISKTEILGKVAELDSKILLDNQSIKVTQTALSEKLDLLNFQNEQLKNDLVTNNQSLNDKLTDLQDSVTSDIDNSLNLQSENLKSFYEEQNQLLNNQILNNEAQINNLKSLVETYNQDDINSRNSILTNFSNLENQLNGISDSINNLASNPTSNDLTGLNDSINNLNNTTKSGLIDENQKPYLKSLDEKLTLQTQGLENNNEASNELNSTLSNELNYTFNKYSDLLGSGYCSAPKNINVSLMGQNFTLLDFSVLAPYVDYIRTVFLSIAYILGLFFFLRGK